MVHYKLTYFNGRGAAEISRQLFALAGQEYEDVRYERDEWPQHKDEMPFGQIPVLEVDGKKLAQSYAINRFLARQFGFSGKTPFEDALVDSLADQYKDYQTEIRPVVLVLLGFQEGDLEKLKTDVLIPATNKLSGFLTKFLKESKSGFLVGDSLTWVDLYVAEGTATAHEKFPELINGFPEIKAHMEKIRSIPALKKWIETRPKTEF